jgi:hypothetical protein
MAGENLAVVVGGWCSLGVVNGSDWSCRLAISSHEQSLVVNGSAFLNNKKGGEGTGGVLRLRRQLGERKPVSGRVVVDGGNAVDVALVVFVRRSGVPRPARPGFAVSRFWA